MRLILALTATLTAVAPIHAQMLEPSRGSSPATQDASPAVTRGPRIELDAREKDFGEIFDDQKQIAYFKFRNVGQTPLVIRQIKTTCGCTAPKMEKDTYAPGEEGQIEVHFNPARKNGRVQQRVTILSNDVVSDQIQLNIVAKVNRRVIIDPPVVNFHQAGRNEQSTKIVTVAGRGEEFSIESMEFTNPAFFEAEILGDKMVEIDGERRRQFEIEVTLAKSVPVGRNTTQLTLKTNESSDDESGVGDVVITCSANIAGDLLATPTRVQLRNLKPGTPYTAQVRLTHRGGQPFNIVNTMVTDQNKDEPEIVIKPIDAKAYRIIINGTVPEEARYVRGTLQIKTDIPGEEIKKINYYGNIVRR